MMKIYFALSRQRMYQGFKIIIMALGLLLYWQIEPVSANNELLQQNEKKVVTGIILDANTGEPLPGVSILIKGTASGVITDADGRFSINVTPENVLVFSYVGYLDEEVAVGPQTEITLKLSPDIVGLEEVVVVGYGVQKKKLATGATVHVENTQIENKHSLRIEQALQGISPGVQITSNSGQPGEGLKVRIRGVGTVGNSNPLYIVDGVPVDDIQFLSPSEVESVDVLKDAASAAIYGARAANGVVLITTTKGKSGELQLTYDGYYGVQNTPKKLDLLNASDYCTIMNEQAVNSKRKAIYSQETIDTIGEGTNWMDYLFNKNAPIQSHVISIVGGSEKSIFSSSFSYFRQEGIIGTQDKSMFERYSVRINSEHKLYKNILKVSENLVYSNSNIRGVGVGDKYNSAVRGFLNTSPTFPVYDKTQDDGYGRSWISDQEANPLALMHYKDFDKDKHDVILGNLSADLEVLKGLKLTSNFGINLLMKNSNGFDPIYHLSTLDLNEFSRARMSMERNFTYNFENYITYTKTINDHNIVLLIGNTIEKYSQFKVSGEKEDLIFDDFDHAILDNGTNSETQVTNGSKLERALLSYYGRLNYNYGEKYLLSATYRIDGSSKFGPENRYGFFPSVSVGWVLSQEDFLKFDWLNYFKLRGSWGQNGNDKILDFMYEATIQSTLRDYYFGADDTKAVGASPDKINNPKLKWETSEQFDVGFDSRFFKAFSLSFDAYKKTTKDWLIIAPVTALAGTDAPTINGGDVKNTGFEIALGYQKILGDFRYSIDANLSHNKNEVVKINNKEGIIHGETNELFHGHSEVYRAQEGYPIGYFYGYKALGIFQSDQEVLDYSFNGNPIQGSALAGDVKFADIAGTDSLGNPSGPDGKISGEDRTMIGNPYPDVVCGLSFNADYKGFDLSFTLQGVFGNEILMGLRSYERKFNNYTTDILDRWTPEHPSNEIPRVTENNEQNQNHNRISDMLFIKDGGYVKLKSINIGYDFKTSIMKKLPIHEFRLYVSATNLFTITKYPGLDPEVGYGDYDATRYNNYSTGIDIGYYPIPRTYMVGLNIKF
jgi:TonB-linked SusC/RagA family outer membrane protein